MNRRNHPAKSAEAAEEEEKDDTKKGDDTTTGPETTKQPGKSRSAKAKACDEGARKCYSVQEACC